MLRTRMSGHTWRLGHLVPQNHLAPALFAQNCSELASFLEELFQYSHTVSIVGVTANVHKLASLGIPAMP
jgi:hypothetical protein